MHQIIMQLDLAISIKIELNTQFITLVLLSSKHSLSMKRCYGFLCNLVRYLFCFDFLLSICYMQMPMGNMHLRLKCKILYLE